jgi:hypothetical protein
MLVFDSEVAHLNNGILCIKFRLIKFRVGIYESGAYNINYMFLRIFNEY